MPAVEAPLPAASAPCVKAPAAAFPAIRPAAGVRLPVFVLRVTTVLVRACASRGAVLGGAVVVQIFMQPRPLLRAPRWSSLASEAQHMARFEREVKTVAALNHMATICGQRCQPQGH